jgi:UDP-N-acetylmuramyl pentapeptide phosphotransferase/UDP-N-acetylglucosamine-1-phosphate transferase
LPRAEPFFALVGILVGLAALLTWAMIRVRILDVPGPRSSHDRPVPRAGGIAMVATFFAGFAWLAWSGGLESHASPLNLAGLAAGALLVALVGLADDLGKVDVRGKLAGQIVASILLAACGVAFRQFTLPGIGTVMLGGWGYLATIVWLVAITNMVNFMDGLDGLAGGTGAIAAAFFAVAAAGGDAPGAAVLAGVLAAACFGFTLFNAPRARIFMGDVGSQFLGFTLAALAVLATGHDTPRISALVMPLLLFHFIFDTVLTFARRLSEGRDVTKAHRGHLYQLLNRLGASHIRVSLFHWVIGIAQGLAALWLVHQGPGARILTFLPFFAFETAYAAVVLRAARRRGVVAG